MANVDKCVRECELALSSDVAFHAHNIAGLPNDQKVAIFRRRDANFVSQILENCKKSIQIKIANDFYQQATYTDIVLEKASDNNKLGADLLHRLPNNETIEIELKFGLETDKQIGMAQFATVFGTDIFTQALNLDIRKTWIDAFRVEENAETQQQYRLSSQLIQAIDGFNVFNQSRNWTLAPTAQDYMESLIINNSGNEIKTDKHYLKFVVDGENMRDIKQLPTGLGKWNIDEVKQLNDTVKRVNVFITNKTTNLQIKFTLNWKNNYKVSNKGKVPAKLGLGSPSWNVWITADLSELDFS